MKVKFSMCIIKGTNIKIMPYRWITICMYSVNKIKDISTWDSPHIIMFGQSCISEHIHAGDDPQSFNNGPSLHTVAAHDTCKD